MIQDPFLSSSFDWSKLDRGGIYEVRDYGLVEVSESRRLLLWERAACFVLDTLTRTLDAFTRWLQR